MKKCCQCRTKIKVKRKDSATNDPISMHSEEFKRIVDTRKERVNIVFKIMYVFAIFFGAIFFGSFSHRFFGSHKHIHI